MTSRVLFHSIINYLNVILLQESVDVIRLESELGVKLGADGQSFDFGQCYLGLEKVCRDIKYIISNFSKVQRVWVRNTSGRSVEFNITSDCPAEVRNILCPYFKKSNSVPHRFVLTPLIQNMKSGQINLARFLNVQ